LKLIRKSSRISSDK